MPAPESSATAAPEMPPALVPAASNLTTTPPAPAPHLVPPYFAKLFAYRQTFQYTHVEAIDLLGDGGPRNPRRRRMTCTVSDVQHFEQAIASRLDCTAIGEHDEDRTTEVMVFISAPGGLWTTLEIPSTQLELGAIVQDPPAIPDVPVARSRRFDRPAGGDQVDRCTERIEASALSVCRDERCEPAAGHGKTHARTCYTRGRGLESLRRENLDGPAVVTWRLERVDPPPVLDEE
jgi:hypothetical protein